ncbi:MAG: FtsX-like permease family protein [Chloroflexi bacterium]|nr:FtsX-like permease family protein [Chloroflexota bacterium]
MIKTRGRKIIRDILARRGRTALVSISIMVGVFGAVTLISTNDLLLSQIKEDVQSDEIAMARVFVAVPSSDTVITLEDNLQMLATLGDPEQNLGVTAVQGQMVAPVSWRTPEEAASDTRFKDAYLLAYLSPLSEGETGVRVATDDYSPLEDVQIEPMQLHDGGWPAPGEIVVERRFAEENDLEAGDFLTFQPFAAEDAEVQEWRISGLVFHPYWVEGTSGTAEAVTRIYANFEDAETIVGSSALSTFYLRYRSTERAEAQVDELEALIRNTKLETESGIEGETIAQTKYTPMGTWLDDPDNYFLIGEVEEITNVLDILAYVALIVSGFLVTNVVNTIVVEQKRQIGVLKSIGATRLDNFAIYAGIAILYGIIGTIPGVILGVIAGSAMAQAVGPLADTLIEGFNVSLLAVVIGAVMGILVPVVAALIPVFNGTRVTIMDAMTDLGIASNWGQGRLARWIKALPLPTNIRQAFSNVVQKQGRLALTVITLTLATAAFMGVFAMFNSLTNEINALYDTFKFEISISPTQAQSFDEVRALIVGEGETTDGEALEPIAGVKAVHPGVNFGVEVFKVGNTALDIQPNTVEVGAIGFDTTTASDAAIFQMEYTDGSGWNPDDPTAGVVLTKPAMTLLDAEVGDMVGITAGGVEREYEVVGVINYPFELALMQWEELATLAGFVDNSDNPQPTTLFVQLEDSDAAASEVDDVIDAISRRLRSEYGITAEYGNQVQEQEDQTQQFLVFGMIFQITSGVMAAVGAIGLLTTLSMAVFERQKEIGVMRSIGARSSTIISQFLTEGLLIGVIAWIIAVPLSYLLGIALMNSLGFDDLIEFTYQPWILLLGLAGMLIVAMIASLWPAIAASRKTVSDILRYQ